MFLLCEFARLSAALAFIPTLRLSTTALTDRENGKEISRWPQARAPSPAVANVHGGGAAARQGAAPNAHCRTHFLRSPFCRVARPPSPSPRRPLLAVHRNRAAIS